MSLKRVWVHGAGICALVGLSLAGCGSRGDKHAEGLINAHHEHAAAAHTAQEATPQAHLPAGERWPSDEPLRSAMSRIREAQEGSQAATEGKKLAETIEREVSYMVEHCSLEPNADSALHGIIGRLLGAASTLRSDPASSSARAELAAALKDYAETFKDPWRQ